MKKALSSLKKDYIREILNSKARFLSIFTLVALGVFVLVGLTVSGSVIRESLETFIKDSETHDLSLIVLQGLEDKDIEKIEGLSGKKEEEYLRLVDLQSKSDGYNFRVKSLPKKLSLPKVEEGRLPRKKGEIFLDEGLKEEGYRLGKLIDFRQEKNKFDPEAEPRLHDYSYKIVGFGKSVEFLDETSKGRSKDGGSLKAFAYISPDNFSDQSFQQYNVQFKDLSKEKTWTKDYEKKVDAHREELDNLLENRPEERLEKSISDFEKEIQDGEKEIDQGKEELKQGKKDLEEAKKELEKSEKELAQAKAKLETGILEGKNQQKQAQIDLLEGEKSILENENKLQQGQSALNQGKAQIAQEKSQLESKAEEVTQGMVQLKTLLLGVERGQDEIERQKNQINQSLQDLEEKEKNSSLPYTREEIQEIKKHILDLRLRRADLLAQSLALENQASEARKRAEEKLKNLPKNVLDHIESQPLSYTGDNESIFNWSTSNAKKGSLFTDKPSIDESIKEIGSWFNFFPSLFTNKNSHFPRNADIDYSFVDQMETETEEVEVAEEAYPTNLDLEEEPLRDQGLTEEEVQVLKQYKEARREAEEKEALLEENKRAREEITREIRQEEEKLYEQSQAILHSGQIFNGLEIGQITSQSLIEVQKRILLEQKKQLDLAQRTLDFAGQAVNPQKQALEDGQRRIDQGRRQLNAAEAELAKQEGALLQGKKELEAGRKRIAQGKNELDKGSRELEEKKKAGEQKIQKGQEELAKGKKEYQEGKEEYRKEYPKALQEIKDGEKDLERARDILTIIKTPTYTISPRSEDPMLHRVFDYAFRVDNLAKIFPIFFFAVAMLLCSTTMNRMVEEERINIGTYKALGYNNGAIAGKYITYGVLAATIGGILGGLTGNYLLSYLIAKAYTTGYAIPDLIVRFYPWQNAIAILLGTLATGLVAYLTVRTSVRQNASALMRPKAPKQGTRILVERIPFMWNRMGFLQKVTARNIFRYKKRMLMTVLGVMGCVALLVLGFGIQSSVNGLVDKQFGELTLYDMIIIHEKALDKEAFEKYKKDLEEDSRIEKYVDARLETVTVDYEDGLDQDVTTIIPSKDSELDELVILRNRKTKDPIALSQDGVVITEKLSDLIGVEEGDILTFKTQEDYEVSLKVSGITEGYAGHYMYMTKGVYEVAFGDEYKENIDLVEVRPKDKKEITTIEEEYTENDSVLAVLDLSDIEGLMEQLTGSIGQIVIVIILASTLLAIVVLFTLTNINIQERKRELSTIKVLGFYPKELTAYVYRETGTLSIIGILLGFVVGKILHYYVMRMVVPDQSMLDPELRLMNYLIPGLITLAISGVVCLIVHQSLKRINMVEALKAVE